MIIAIDLGGTKIRGGLVDGSSVRDIIQVPCKASGSEQDVLEQLYSLIDRLVSPEVTAIGVGVPSVVDAAAGIIYDVVAIPSWKEVHLKEILQAKYHIPVSVDNDCNCFAIGVVRYGEARGYEDAVCVTLGTGVGSGIVVGGRLYRGVNTGAGEIGCIPYLDKDYEYYCSSRFFEGKGTTGKDVAEAARKGDAEALSIMSEFGTHVGKLVKLILFAYDPQAIVLGGSISNAFDFFKGPMYRELDDFPYSKSVERLKIHRCQTDHIGLFGAAAICE